MRKSIDHVNQMGATDPSPDALFEAIHAVMHQYRALQYQARRDDPHALSHMDGKVLGYFAHHGGATQKDLATHSGRDKGQLARLIGGLRERGLLDAQPDPDDRRSTQLRLTPAGDRALAALQAQIHRVAVRAAARLSTAERSQLVHLLQKVQDGLADDR